LTGLNISNNKLGGTFENYNHDGSGYGDFTATPEGPKAIADAIRDNRAMTSLNLAANGLRVEGAKVVAEAIKVRQCVVAVVLVP
jgi:hypothetical protein